MNKGDIFKETFVVSRAVYQGFLDTFKDSNPLHTDAVFAQQKGFKAEVMQGNILNGFVSYFIGMCLPVKNVIIQAQEIKFYKPVYLDDSLQFQAEVVDYYESVNTIEFKYYFENSAGVKVARGKVQIGLI